LQYLARTYEGVFSTADLEGHVKSHVLTGSSRELIQVLSAVAKPGSRVLDIGSGFGTFVTVCRLSGYYAEGIELSGFEVDFANRRLAHLGLNDKESQVFHEADALQGSIALEKFDVVTLWNVVEHVEDLGRLFEVVRQATHGCSRILLICPNYLAWTREAHYRIKWNPLMLCFPGLARTVLKKNGHSLGFFDYQIFPRSSWRILREARRAGFRCSPLMNATKEQSLVRGLVSWAVHFFPFKPTVALLLEIRIPN